jgi:serine/threonine-protein phosphatase CPPED1
MDKFTTAFGDDYLAFWVNGTYNIVLNSNIISNPSDAQDLYDEQLTWLQERLQYAQDHHARLIFVFGHHPWFLYDDQEDESELTGASIVTDWGPTTRQFPDGYFVLPKVRRQVFLQLFEQYKVKACFSGHFHQNHVAKTSFGMDMIITGPLSIVFDSTGKKKTNSAQSSGEHHNDNHVEPEPTARGVRLVQVDAESSFTHRFLTLDEWVTGSMGASTVH